MKKRLILEIVCGILIYIVGFFVGDASAINRINNNIDLEQGINTFETEKAETEELTNVENEDMTEVTVDKVSESKMLSSEDKEKIKTKVKNVIGDKKITDISILTDSATGEPIISVQIELIGEKDTIENSYVEKEINDIVESTKDISDKCVVEAISSDYQLIAIYSDGSIEFK